MKVKVNFAQPTILVKREAYQAEREELRALREEVVTLKAALESAYEYQETTFQEKKDVERKLVETERDFKSLKHKFADVCAERDNMTAAYKQLEFSFIEQQKQFAQQYHEQEEKACDTYSELFAKYLKQKDLHRQEISGLIEALADRDVRVNELEQRNEWLKQEAKSLDRRTVELEKSNDELRQTIEVLKNEAAVHREEKAAFEDIIRSFDETRKDYEAEIARVCHEKQDLYARLEDTQNDLLTQKALVTIHRNTAADREKIIAELRKQLEEPNARFYQFLKENNLLINFEGGPHNAN